MTTSGLLLAAVAIVAVCAATAAPGATAAAVAGGWSPIKNISDPHIQELGQWVVSVVNKNASTSGPLTFSKVTGGEQQEVNGMNYRLDIDASRRLEGIRSYQAEVYEKDSTTRKLISFDKN